MKRCLLFLFLFGALAHAGFDGPIVRGQNVEAQATSSTVPSPGPHSVFCGLRVGIQGLAGSSSPVLTFGVKHNVDLNQLGGISNANGFNYCNSSGLFQDPTLKVNVMAEASTFLANKYPNECGKKFVAWQSATTGAAGRKPFGWSHGGNVQYTWDTPPCKLSPEAACKAKAPAGYASFGVFTDTTAQCCNFNPKTSDNFCCVTVKR